MRADEEKRKGLMWRKSACAIQRSRDFELLLSAYATMRLSVDVGVCACMRAFMYVR